MSWLRDKLLAYVLSGYKTYIAGIGLIGLGAYEISQSQTDQGIQHVAEGLAVFGIGHKLDKQTAAIAAANGSTNAKPS